MRRIARWRHLMSSTVSVAARSANDGYGAPSYGTAVSYKAHISRERKMVRTAEGQEVVSGQTVYLNGSPNVQPSALVTLSTADVGSTESWAIQPRILSVERRSDNYGPHHTVLYLG